MTDAQRTWAKLGRAVMAEINCDASEDGRPTTVKVVERAIEHMAWEEPPNRLPMSPGLAIQQLIRQLELPGVDRISYRNQGGSRPLRVARHPGQLLRRPRPPVHPRPRP